MVGIDLDNCIHNGKIDAWAQKIIDRFNSYTEISPSGTGVHIIVLGSIPANRKSGSIEMYDHSRYFTYTGNRVPGTPETVEYRQDALDSLYLEITKVGYIDATPLSENSLHDVSGLSMLSDDEVLQKAQSNPKSGPKFSRLWAGDITLYITEQHPQGDHSRADQALVESLVYWCNGDTDMVDRLFRRSGLYRPEKWGREDYRARTIKRAFAFVGQLS